MIKIACIEDDEVLLKAMEQFLEHQEKFEFVIKSHSIGNFLEEIDSQSTIDIVLLDIFLGEHNSLDHIYKIKKILPAAKIVVITGHQDTDYLLKALEAGAHSYYLKSSPPSQLVDTILATYQGGSFLDPRAASSLVEYFQDKKTSSEAVSFGAIAKQWDLSAREVQVAEGLFIEKTYKEIAQTCNISIDTVRHYTKSLYKKMEVRSRLQLIRKIREFSFPKNS